MKIIDAERGKLIIVRSEQDSGGWYVYRPGLLQRLLPDHKHVLQNAGEWSGPFPEGSVYDILLPDLLPAEVAGIATAYFALAYERRKLDEAWEYYRNRIVAAFTSKALGLAQAQSIEQLTKGGEKISGVVVNQKGQKVASLYIVGQATKGPHERKEYVHISAHPLSPPSLQLIPLFLSFDLTMEKSGLVLKAMIPDAVAIRLHRLYEKRKDAEDKAKNVSKGLADTNLDAKAIYCQRRGRKLPTGGFVVVQRMPAKTIGETVSPAHVGMRWVFNPEA